MTKRELITALKDFDDDNIIIIGNDVWWSNIKEIRRQKHGVALIEEYIPAFSDTDPIV